MHGHPPKKRRPTTENGVKNRGLNASFDAPFCRGLGPHSNQLLEYGRRLLQRAACLDFFSDNNSQLWWSNVFSCFPLPRIPSEKLFYGFDFCLFFSSLILERLITSLFSDSFLGISMMHRAILLVFAATINTTLVFAATCNSAYVLALCDLRSVHSSIGLYARVYWPVYKSSDLFSCIESPNHPPCGVPSCACSEVSVQSRYKWHLLAFLPLTP